MGRYEKTGYKDHFINVEGFLDIYNWINIEDFSSTSGLVPSTGIESVDAIVGTTGAQIIANELLQPEYSGVRHTFNGQEYVHLGIAVLGMTSPVTDGIVRDFENAGYARHSVTITGSSLTGLFQIAFNSVLKPYVRYPLYVYSYKEGNYQIGPDSEKNLTSRKRARFIKTSEKEGRQARFNDYDKQGKMLAGQVYDPNDEEIVSEQFEYLNAMKAYNALPYGDKREDEYIRKCFGSIGKQPVVTQPFSRIGAASTFSSAITFTAILILRSSTTGNRNRRQRNDRTQRFDNHRGTPREPEVSIERSSIQRRRENRK